jgi:hypothetical protein
LLQRMSLLLTHRCHWMVDFVVLHNSALTQRWGTVRPGPRRGPHEATRVHHAAQRRGGVAICGAGAATRPHLGQTATHTPSRSATKNMRAGRIRNWPPPADEYCAVRAARRSERAQTLPQPAPAPMLKKVDAFSGTSEVCFSPRFRSLVRSSDPHRPSRALAVGLEKKHAGRSGCGISLRRG